MAVTTTNRKERLPDFLIVGAAKSGTSTLYEYLLRHSRIYMSPIKEPCFFDANETWSRGIDWYRSLFVQAEARQICGEASTNYTRWPQVSGVPARIAETLPKVKLIYIMRHPVDRAYSHYLHRHTKEVYKGQAFVKTFEEFVEDDPLCLDSSDYMMQIDQYLEYFARDSFLFLFTAELEADPNVVLSKVFRFLGVEDTASELAEPRVFANTGGDHRYHTIRRSVTEPLRRIPTVSRVASLLPQFSRDIAHYLISISPYGRKVRRAYSPVPMRPETRERLLERYRGPNQALSESLGVDLSHWEK